MGDQSFKATAAAAAPNSVEKTQRIVDLATDDDQENSMVAKDNDSGKDTVGKRKGKGKQGAREKATDEEDRAEAEPEAEAEGRGDGFEGDGWEEGEVERGMLHALVELGHLEMLLHQVWVCV